ncbi:MAG: alanine--tRNA ligase [bacterium]|nr:alanine--tRNA ligase [bacterium]
MNSNEIRTKFIEFFKQNDHLRIPGSSLISEDPTLLFVNAGMVQFKPYFLGLKKPLSKRITDFQKCFRMIDIDKVGNNNRTLTFFEMLGNWSIGDYGRKKAISYAWELLTKIYKINKERLWVSIFKGEKNIPYDRETLEVWMGTGIKRERIVELGLEDNFWIGGPTGPCGPCSEIYYDLGEDFGCGKNNCKPGCDCNRFLEIWNLVFIEYCRDEKGNTVNLPIKSIDTGAGLERLAIVLQQKSSIFETDLFAPIIEKIRNWKFEIGNSDLADRSERIIADHTKSAVFLISEGVFPSNVEKGYILRRILRRAIRFGKLLKLPKNFLITLAQKVFEIYREVYPELKSKGADILTIIQKEEEKFEETLDEGIKALKKIYGRAIGGVDPENLPEGMVIKDNIIRVDGQEIFHIYETYGLPPELSQEIMTEWGIRFDDQTIKECGEAFKKHQEISRAGLEKKFGGHGLKDGGEITGATEEEKQKIVQLHTATHLLHQVLADLFGENIKQMGSDINPERFRFDFPFERKLTPEEITKIEEIVNQKIKENLPVRFEEKTKEEAIAEGAKAFFKIKYPDKVKIYSIGDYSKEICNGPHVKNTSEIGKFKIIKEEAVGAGIRRIKATID